MLASRVGLMKGSSGSSSIVLIVFPKAWFLERVHKVCKQFEHQAGKGVDVITTNYSAFSNMLSAFDAITLDVCFKDRGREMNNYLVGKKIHMNKLAVSGEFGMRVLYTVR